MALIPTAADQIGLPSAQPCAGPSTMVYPNQILSPGPFDQRDDDGTYWRGVVPAWPFKILDGELDPPARVKAMLKLAYAFDDKSKCHKELRSEYSPWFSTEEYSAALRPALDLVNYLHPSPARQYAVWQLAAMRGLCNGQTPPPAPSLQYTSPNIPLLHSVPPAQLPQEQLQQQQILLAPLQLPQQQLQRLQMQQQQLQLLQLQLQLILSPAQLAQEQQQPPVLAAHHAPNDPQPAPSTVAAAAPTSPSSQSSLACIDPGLVAEWSAARGVVIDQPPPPAADAPQPTVPTQQPVVMPQPVMVEQQPAMQQPVAQLSMALGDLAAQQPVPSAVPTAAPSEAPSVPAEPAVQSDAAYPDTPADPRPPTYRDDPLLYPAEPSPYEEPLQGIFLLPEEHTYWDSPNDPDPPVDPAEPGSPAEGSLFNGPLPGDDGVDSADALSDEQVYRILQAALG